MNWRFSTKAGTGKSRSWNGSGDLMNEARNPWCMSGWTKNGHAAQTTEGGHGRRDPAGGPLFGERTDPAATGIENNY